MTPLHYAANEGHVEIVEELLQEIECTDPKDQLGDTPLHLAARQGHLKIVQILMHRLLPNLSCQNGRELPQNFYGMTPLQKAARNGHVQVVELIKSFLK